MNQKKKPTPINWNKLVKTFKFYATRHWIDTTMFAIFIVTPSLIIGFMTNSFWWGIGISIILLLSFLKPFNLQSSVLIAFAAFIFVGLNATWQKENFELRNRPYLQVLPTQYGIEFTKEFRMLAGQPEPKLLIRFGVLNHGAIPATIQTISIQVHPDKNKVDTNDGIFIGAHEIDKVSQWKNIDVFPFLSEKINNGFYFDMTPFLSLDNLRTLGTNNSVIQSYVNFVSEKKITEGNGRISTISNNFGSPIGTYYLILQLEYFALGEQLTGKKPYWYWCLYRISNLQNGNVQVDLVESGTQQKIRKFEE